MKRWNSKIPRIQLAGLKFTGSGPLLHFCRSGSQARICNRELLLVTSQLQPPKRVPEYPKVPTCAHRVKGGSKLLYPCIQQAQRSSVGSHVGSHQPYVDQEHARTSELQFVKHMLLVTSPVLLATTPGNAAESLTTIPAGILGTLLQQVANALRSLQKCAA